MTRRAKEPGVSFRALGERALCPFPARRVPARVLWCQFDLAEQLGFSVPEDRRLDAVLEEELVQAFSFRALDSLERAERDSGVPTVTLHADRYYGSGMADHLGSARGGVVLGSDVFIKGLGRTPLAGAGNVRHSNGRCHLLQCITEALFGELDSHLFTAGATRVVAVLDQHDTVVFDGKRLHAAVMARVGVPIRPAHLVRRLGEKLDDLPALFVELTKRGRCLVRRGRRPDFARTMRRLLRLHARTAAEQVRWRVLHGAISTSNIGLFGEMIDLNSQSTQARTAPLSVQRLRRTRAGSFGGEHLARGRELHLLYLSVIESLTPRRRVALSALEFDCNAEFRAMYLDELDGQLLSATGLPPFLARSVRRAEPALVRRYGDVLRKLMALRNPGALDARVSTCDGIGVVDVFGILGQFPRLFFAAPHIDHSSTLLALAGPRISGDRSRRQRIQRAVEKHVDLLGGLYRELMSVARRVLSLHDGRRGAWPSMAQHVCERAEFENRPLADYYRAPLLREISRLERAGAGSSERLARSLWSFIDVRVARNSRSVDALLRHPVTRDARGLTTQRRVTAGVEHALRSADGERWTIEVSAESPVSPSFFNFSFDGHTWHSARVRVPRAPHAMDARGWVRIVPPSGVGVLEGGFSSREPMADPPDRVLPYAFALPRHSVQGGDAMTKKSNGKASAKTKTTAKSPSAKAAKSRPGSTAAPELDEAALDKVSGGLRGAHAFTKRSPLA